MKTILLKISGTVFKTSASTKELEAVHSIIKQIGTLSNQGYHFGIVMGGGNFFRGCNEGKKFGMAQTPADQVGMLATVMNGIILQDLLKQITVKVTLLSAFSVQGMATTLSQEALDKAQAEKSPVIFVGGTGCPYFSTDTNAIVRGLQINADEVWKATNVDFLYTKDPAKYVDAKPIHKTTFQEAINHRWEIMDATAFSLAQQHQLPIRIFNVWQEDALIKAAHNKSFGSTITV